MQVPFFPAGGAINLCRVNAFVYELNGMLKPKLSQIPLKQWQWLNTCTCFMKSVTKRMAVLVFRWCNGFDPNFSDSTCVPPVLMHYSQSRRRAVDGQSRDQGLFLQYETYINFHPLVLLTDCQHRLEYKSKNFSSFFSLPHFYSEV